MKINQTPIDGLLVIDPRCFQDDRGFFMETYQTERYQDAGIVDQFVQDNQSRSVKGVLRGMHFQVKHPQAQIVTVMRGKVFDVGVDLRLASPTFGQWFGVVLSDAGPSQVYMAPGFAHGFCVLSNWADLHYKVSRNYDSLDEGGLLWNDSDIQIKWPIEHPKLSERDATYPKLKNLKKSQLPHNTAYTFQV
jgi:dTDP-4-dehydrorhamnose 3,5-epimerase